ncbi:MAG: GNAT family N-acetyltransferase [Eubacterium sp.]|nr:GNAT family N-acetyltransferase [Eubacterium sp.]
MRLFEGYPVLSDDCVILRRMDTADCDSLKAFVQDLEVYRYLPTFLYEQKYSDPEIMLERMDEEMIRPKESLFLGVYPVSEPETFAGIAEVYSYEPEREKASIGYRLSRAFWGRGMATHVAKLMKDYLFQEAGIHLITAHIMTENRASARVVRKNGFFNIVENMEEDWGFPETVLVDVYAAHFHGKEENASRG